MLDLTDSNRDENVKSVASSVSTYTAMFRENDENLEDTFIRFRQRKGSMLSDYQKVRDQESPENSNDNYAMSASSKSSAKVKRTVSISDAEINKIELEDEDYYYNDINVITSRIAESQGIFIEQDSNYNINKGFIFI